MPNNLPLEAINRSTEDDGQGDSLFVGAGKINITTEQLGDLLALCGLTVTSVDWDVFTNGIIPDNATDLRVVLQALESAIKPEELLLWAAEEPVVDSVTKRIAERSSDGQPAIFLANATRTTQADPPGFDPTEEGFWDELGPVPESGKALHVESVGPNFKLTNFNLTAGTPALATFRRNALITISDVATEMHIYKGEGYENITGNTLNAESGDTWLLTAKQDNSQFFCTRLVTRTTKQYHSTLTAGGGDIFTNRRYGLDALGGAFTVDITTALGYVINTSNVRGPAKEGDQVVFVRTDASPNVVTITGSVNGDRFIEGQGSEWTFTYDGTDWFATPAPANIGISSVSRSGSSNPGNGNPFQQATEHYSEGSAISYANGVYTANKSTVFDIDAEINSINGANVGNVSGQVQVNGVASSLAVAILANDGANNFPGSGTTSGTLQLNEGDTVTFVQIGTPGFGGTAKTTTVRIKENPKYVPAGTLDATPIGANKFTATSDNALAFPGSTDVITFENFSDTISSGSVASFDGSQLTVTAGDNDIRLTALAFAEGAAAHTGSFYFRDVLDAAGIKLGDGSQQDAVSSRGTYGTSSGVQEAGAVIRAGTTITLNLMHSASTGTHVLQAGSYIQVEEILSRFKAVRPEAAPLIDDDTFATATAENVPSSESVKAYVDANAGGLAQNANNFTGTPGATTGSLTIGNIGTGHKLVLVTGYIERGTDQQRPAANASNSAEFNFTRYDANTGDVVLVWSMGANLTSYDITIHWDN